MKFLLCAFVILLSLCVYPIILRIPIEITQTFGRIEVDIFSWYRMWLVVIFGSFFLIFLKDEIPKTIYAYWALLSISTIFSKYYRTSIFGSPWTHEGLIAITGYIGIYLTSKKYGLFKGLERAFDTVIIIAFLASILQIIYGSPLLFPPIKRLMPSLDYELSQWPLYSVFGSSNHLGLFCALFFPYTIIKKKYYLSLPLLFMAICSETRAAWLSIFATTTLISRKMIFYVLIASATITLVFHKEVVPRIQNTIHAIHFPIKESDLDGRIYIWKKSIPQLKKTILIGHGPNNYAMRMPQYEHFPTRVIDRPHNAYLNIWIESGLVSLIILLLAFWVILYSDKTLKKDKALQMGVLGFLIAALFTDSVLCVTPYFIIFLGALSHKKNWWEQERDWMKYEYNEKRGHA